MKIIWWLTKFVITVVIVTPLLVIGAVWGAKYYLDHSNRMHYDPKTDTTWYGPGPANTPRPAAESTQVRTGTTTVVRRPKAKGGRQVKARPRPCDPQNAWCPEPESTRYTRTSCLSGVCYTSLELRGDRDKLSRHSIYE